MLRGNKNHTARWKELFEWKTNEVEVLLNILGYNAGKPKTWATGNHGNIQHIKLNDTLKST